MQISDAKWCKLAHIETESRSLYLVSEAKGSSFTFCKEEGWLLLLLLFWSSLPKTLLVSKNITS